MCHSINEENRGSVLDSQLSESRIADWVFNSLSLSEREKRRQEDMEKIEADRLRSRPEEQFIDEVRDEEQWLKDIIEQRKGSHVMALQTVIKRWKDQGIWKDEFTVRGDHKWKHEDPLLAGSECQKREREASRPFERFIYQISVERDRLFEVFATPRDLDISPSGPWETAEDGLKAYYQALGSEIRKKRSQPAPDINTMAADLVKFKWNRRGIWDDAWGRGMPGMSWKHERPLEDFFQEFQDVVSD